ncbi:hypothetical protein, partial [Burkholderia territorii]|uniref:hypothetical protein n=1 Tax=Burkholderia territorii TaxID=1503055 RepID=UPI001E446459
VNGESFLLSPRFICAALLRAIPPRERVPGLRAARRIQFTHADTQSKALSGSLFESFRHVLAAAFRRAERCRHPPPNLTQQTIVTW